MNATLPTTLDRPTGALHVALWSLQIVLALLFLAAGVFKVTTPIPDLVAGGMAYAADLPAATRLAGAAEIAGALGLVLPSALRIRPQLTAAAAAGLAVVMALAFAMHAARGEVEGLPINVVLGALAAFVAWGRGVRAPIPAR